MRELPEAQTLLAGLDSPGLLKGSDWALTAAQALDEDALLAELGLGLGGETAATGAVGDITMLRHVRSTTEKRAAEDIADHTPCPDFEKFQPLFEQAQQDMASGIRKTLRFGRDASVASGNYFILGGQLAYVADIGEALKAPNGESDARLRVVFANGTQSNLLRRSLQRALYKDNSGRRLSEPDSGPLFDPAFSGRPEPSDIESGTIYVLRSMSEHPFVAEHRALIYKIGVTGGKVEARIAGADKDATYLLARVEVVATYKLHNMNRTKLESIFHRLFSAAQIDLTIEDRFGHLVKPREWFWVPLHLIDEAVQRIRDGSITGLTYDPKTARLLAP